MKTRWLCFVVLTAVVAASVLAADVTQKKMTPARIFMRQKLVCSQQIVEGISLENYQLVSTNGYHLLSMTQSNVWMRLKTPDYLEKTDHYRKDVMVMLAAAKAAQTPEVLKAYTAVMADCVDCHQAFRLEQHVRGGEKAQKN